VYKQKAIGGKKAKKQQSIGNEKETIYQQQKSNNWRKHLAQAAARAEEMIMNQQSIATLLHLAQC